MIKVLLLVIGGILCIANSSYEGGLKVLFSKRKYEDGRKLDIGISFLLGITGFTGAYFLNKKINPDAFIVTIISVMVIAYFLARLLAKKNQKKYL